MGDAMKKVLPGDRLKIPAKTFNTFVDAARDFQARQHDLPKEPAGAALPNGVVLVKNGTGEDVERFAALALSDLLYDPAADEEAEERFKNSRPVFLAAEVSWPEFRGRWVITSEPIKDGAIGRAVAWGLTPAYVRVLNEAHGFVEVLGEGALATAPEGLARIHWRADPDPGAPDDPVLMLLDLRAPPTDETFWAEITADAGGGAFAWQEMEYKAAGAWQVLPDGRTSDDFGNAYEVNAFNFAAAGIEPVGLFVHLFALHTGDQEEYRFAYGTQAGVLGPTSFWATLTDNAAAPVYEFSSLGGGLSGLAEEVNANDAIEEGTVVRIFITGEEYKFEYASEGGRGLENSFDFIEVWPALVITADGDGGAIEARVWIPNGGGFPPAVGGDDFLTPGGSHVHVEYGKIGAGTFTDGTLLPALKDFDSGEVEDWIQVRCEPGAFVAADAATPIPPDGLIVTFSGTLASVPLPFTATFEWEASPGRWKRLISSRTVNAGDDFKVTLEGDGGIGTVKYRTGGWEVTLNVPPPALATLRVRYIPVSTCKWSWVEVAQTIEGGTAPDPASTIKEGWIVVDGERKTAHGLPKEADAGGGGAGIQLWFASDSSGPLYGYTQNGTFHGPFSCMLVNYDSRGHLISVEEGS